MADNNKLNKERKKLPKGTLIYTLEIAVNPKEGTVEYIVEGLEEISDVSGPINMDSNGYYEYADIEDYFDEDSIKMLENAYIVAES